jgi:uncharacterized protein
MKGNLTKIFCLVFLLWAILLPIAPLQALPISDIPNPRKANGTWVSDVANILSADTESRLNQRISRLAANNGSEIAVVTVPDTAPANTVKAYTTELFNTWGIGKRGLDNGVLFLIAVKERRIEIETGRGISPYISDRQVKQIIEELITPEFKRQNYDRGIINGVEEVAGRIEKINFYPFPFAPIYSSIGLVGIAIAISGVILIMIRIREWRQKLPTINQKFQNPVVFQLEIPKLTKFTSLGLLLMMFGLVAIAVSINAWVLSQEVLTSFFIQPINQFVGTILINLIVAFTSLGVWLSIEKFWLAQLTAIFQTPIQRYETSRFGLELFRNFWLIFVFHFPPLAVLWLITSTAILLAIPSHLLFAFTSLLVAMGYQFLWLYLVKEMYINRGLAKEQYFCQNCRSLLLKYLDSDLTNQYLSKPELKAVELGNATYTGYSCDRCHPQTRDRQHVYCQPNLLNEKAVCPKCSYPTLIDTKLKQSRKTKKSPKKASKNPISMRQCQNCFHEEPVYPFISQSVSYASSSDYSSSSDSSSSSSSYDSSDYGSSSSSSDFGGGGSDGGGSGGDW